MIGCLPTQALAFLAVFVYATHATQEIAFGWKPGFRLQGCLHCNFRRSEPERVFERLTVTLRERVRAFKQT